MTTSLERIRAKIAELDARLADLRIAERELVALEPGVARKTATRHGRKRKAVRGNKAASPPRQTIGAAITDVLNAHGALPAAAIAERIKAGGREIGSRTVSHSLQALKKQGRVRIRGGNWMLPRARSRRASL
jgi:hypothetical protein